MSFFKIEETDSAGQVIHEYRVTSDLSEAKQDSVHDHKRSLMRIDLIPLKSQTETRTGLPKRHGLSTLLATILIPFLPTGYPHTVRPDYTPYQIYDSIQAFASTIASLLASRAVLLSLNLASPSTDSETNATQTATAATLLSIAQESIGRFATIMFAHRFARRIEAEVKFYRFFADIVNDMAFVLDCLSPSLPIWWRIPALCLASACRSTCGVAGGSSKAILSSHFACAGNIGELNAKDSSQETVVNLLGMWAGGVVVSQVHGTLATWFWLLSLLAIHLWANYMAVCSVSLTTLNRGRAQILLQKYAVDQTLASVVEVNSQEEIMSFDRSNLNASRRYRYNIGASFEEFVTCMQMTRIAASGSFHETAHALQELIEVFSSENFLLWWNRTADQLVVLFKDGADGRDQLKSWHLAMRLTNTDSARKPSDAPTSDTLLQLQRILKETNDVWSRLCSDLEARGWNLKESNLETGQQRRVRL